MSLFKSREWWCTQCGTEEQFDKTSILVARLNSDYQYVIVGSHSGVLRIYQPISDKLDDGHLTGYRPNDLIIEIQLPIPILQICVGRLVSGSQIIQLAILHPRSVGVYSLVTKTGVAEYGNQNHVLLVYEHTLKRSASNLIVGPFGGPLHRDFMCIQSLDGMLTFFEQEIFSFCCFLPEFLLPGPIVFVKSTDSFITIGSNWQIESYSYKRLSENGQNSNLSDTEGRKFDADWSYNIGENVLDISVVECGLNDTNVVILGEKNMFCLVDSGKLKFMKRFDFSAHCFHPYYINVNSKLMTLVVSETNTLLLFENASLRWSAQLSFLPISIGRGFFGCVDGTLVLLSDTGLLQFCYLGTEPQLFTAPPLQNQEIDFEKTEQELNRLNKIIKSHRNNDIALINATTERELSINLKINPHLELCTFQHEILLNEEDEEILQMCLVSVELTPNSPFEEVQVSLIVEQPLKIYPNIHFINNLDDKIILDSYAYLSKPLEVTTLEIKVIVSHIASTGVPRILSKSTQLPMKLIYKTETPFKDATHKITLNINQQAPPLTVLFSEFVGEKSLSQSSNAVCFKNISDVGSPVTILSAKNSQRYRLQSNSCASLNILVQEMVFRLNKHFDKSDLFISFSSPLPLGQFLEVINLHFDKKEIVNNLQNQLSELSSQFRLIQKRLITKFKDKNPTPLNNLDILMYETYSEITECSDSCQLEKEELLKLQCELSCLIRLILTIIKYSEVPEHIFKQLNSIFVTPVCDITDQGWEDVIEICMSHLFRTVIAKSEKDRLKNTSNTFEHIKDINKFKKRISQLLDRAVKFTDAQENISEKEKGDIEVLEIPELLNQVGNKIAASSVRVQSAKMNRSKLLTTPEENEEEV